MTSPAEYVGLFPWMAQWWTEHLNVAPVVVIRCGHRDTDAADTGTRRKSWCTNAVGEVKAVDNVVLAMSRNQHPEVETDWTPLAAPTVEELNAELAERDAQVLRYVGDGPGDGKIVYRRTTLPREVAPVEDLTFYVCRTHGEIEIDTAALAAAAAEAAAAGRIRWTYWARPGVD